MSVVTELKCEYWAFYLLNNVKFYNLFFFQYDESSISLKMEK